MYGFDGCGFLCMGMIADVFQRVGIVEHRVNLILSTKRGKFLCTLFDDPRPYPVWPWIRSAPDHLPVHVLHTEGKGVFWVFSE